MFDEDSTRIDGMLTYHDSKTSRMFDTVEQEWLKLPLPSLQEARYDHGSCTSGETAFVFGGAKTRGKMPDSVEYLTFKDQGKGVIGWLSITEGFWKSFRLNI